MTRADRLPLILTALIVAAAAVILYMAGRLPICACGEVKLWHGEVISAENSQHLSDWYTPSHIIHGLLFYAVLHLVARGLSLSWRLSIATVVEAAWEIVENSPMVIDRYRTATIALDYYGDSIVNSVADIVAMWVGFALARVLPVWASVALIVVFEAVTIWLIRDGLALNVLMLVWPVEGIMQWQSAR